MKSDSARPDHPSPLVLLLEDNETDVFVIREVLKRCGIDFRLRVCTDGQDALEYLREIESDEKSTSPALILLDLNVPKIPGGEVLRQFRRSSRCSHIPVIVVSSSDSQSDRDVAHGLGAEAYFRKPSNLTAYLELADVIKRVLPPPA